MIISGDVEVPNECPTSCSGKLESFDQSCLCARCPLFVCKPFVYKGSPMCLVDPEDYRKDWAIAWREWFEKGAIGAPELLL